MSHPNWNPPPPPYQPGPWPRPQQGPYGGFGQPAANQPFAHQGFPSRQGYHGWTQPQPFAQPHGPAPGGFHGAPYGWAPEAPRRKGAGGAVLLGCGLVLLLPIIGLVLFFLVAAAMVGADDPTPRPTPAVSTTPAEPTPTPTPREPDPEPTPTPSPVETPFRVPDRDFGELPPPHSDHPAWVTVQQAAIYRAEFPAQQGCPPPRMFSTMSEMRDYTTPQLACVQSAWQPVLQSLGLPSHTIPHYYYNGESATSPCGTSTAPAFYCSSDGGAIYFGEGLLRGTSWDPIWAKDLVGHEYGHHLQALSGFFPAMRELSGGTELDRRLEIQATCFAMGGLRRDNSYELDQEFYDHLEQHLRSFLDDGIHGSETSLAYWGMRGFHAGPVGECNTWVVGSEWVE